MADIPTTGATQPSSTAAPAPAPVSQATASTAAAPTQPAAPAPASPASATPAPAAASPAKPETWVTAPASAPPTPATAPSSTAATAPAPATPAAPAATPAPAVALKLPADPRVSAKDIESVTALAATLKLAPEAAQQLLDATDARLRAYETEVKTGWQEKTNSWMTAIKSDPDFGGAKFDASKEGANRVLFKYADPEFIKELNESGLDRHPGFFRMLARLGSESRDDRVMTDKGSGGGTADMTDKSFQRELYPTMHAQKA